jgi:Cu+-exporting ATPase
MNFHDPEEVLSMAIAIDPVCGMEVDTGTSQLKLEHDGTTYWFCGRGCLLDFQENPDIYLDPGYTPSME